MLHLPGIPSLALCPPPLHLQHHYAHSHTELNKTSLVPAGGKGVEVDFLSLELQKGIRGIKIYFWVIIQRLFHKLRILYSETRWKGFEPNYHSLFPSWTFSLLFVSAIYFSFSAPLWLWLRFLPRLPQAATGAVEARLRPFRKSSATWRLLESWH